MEWSTPPPETMTPPARRVEADMKKVFEDFDIALVGHFQSVLEAHGIDTFMKNRFGTGGTGGVTKRPFGRCGIRLGNGIA